MTKRRKEEAFFGILFGASGHARISHLCAFPPGDKSGTERDGL